MGMKEWLGAGGVVATLLIFGSRVVVEGGVGAVAESVLGELSRVDCAEATALIQERSTVEQLSRHLEHCGTDCRSATEAERYIVDLGDEAAEGNRLTEFVDAARSYANLPIVKDALAEVHDHDWSRIRPDVRTRIRDHSTAFGSLSFFEELCAGHARETAHLVDWEPIDLGALDPYDSFAFLAPALPGGHNNISIRFDRDESGAILGECIINEFEDPRVYATWGEVDGGASLRFSGAREPTHRSPPTGGIPEVGERFTYVGHLLSTHYGEVVLVLSDRNPDPDTLMLTRL